MPLPDLEQAWPSIVAQVNVGDEIYTLVQRSRNVVEAVASETVLVKSDNGQAIRSISKEAVRPWWRCLSAQGMATFSPAKDAPRPEHSSVFAAFLVQYVPQISHPRGARYIKAED